VSLRCVTLSVLFSTKRERGQAASAARVVDGLGRVEKARLSSAESRLRRLIRMRLNLRYYIFPCARCVIHVDLAIGSLILVCAGTLVAPLDPTMRWYGFHVSTVVLTLDAVFPFSGCYFLLYPASDGATCPSSPSILPNTAPQKPKPGPERKSKQRCGRQQS
jgi:hypothetical protein